MIAFSCRQCGQKLRVQDESAGKKVKCPGCGKVLTAALAANLATVGVTAASIPGVASSAPSAAAGGADADAPTLPPSESKAGRETEAEAATPVARPEEEKFAGLLAPPQQADEIGRLGPFRVLKVLGAGGMGVVFLAEDVQLRRAVALKAMLPGIAQSPSNRERFLREARAAAAVEHDHVIHINQVGEANGVPFLAMPLLQGEALETRLRRQGPLPLPEVLRIGREVAEGLAAAHERGLIHRDIKPANVWLEGAAGRVKILDFGLARSAEDSTHLTVSGAVMGTPAYMAPEQAGGSAVDHRTDLFSLGCMLYRMCTGELPFKGATTMQIISALALQEPTRPRALNPAIPAALEELILTLLAKAPTQRPRSARQVAERLGALERKGPAEAGLHSAATRTGETRRRQAPEGKTVAVGVPARRRHRLVWVAVGAAAGAAILLVASVILFIQTDQGTLRIETRDRDVKVVVEQDGREVRVIDTKTGSEVHLHGGEYRLRLGEGRKDLEVSPGRITLKRGQTVVATITPVAKAPAPAQPSSTQPSSTQPTPSAEVLRFESEGGGVGGIALSPDGHSVLVGSEDPVARLYSLENGKLLRTLAEQEKGPVRAVAFTPDGKRALSGGASHFLRLSDVASGQEVRRFPGMETWFTSVACSPDGHRAVSTGHQNLVILWDLDTGQELKQFAGHTRWATCVAYAPDGKHVLSGSEWEDTTLRLWDVDTGKQVAELTGHTQGIFSVAFSPDGRHALSGSKDTSARLWDVAAAKELCAFTRHTGPVRAVAFSPDGGLAASGGDDRTVRIWEVATGKEVVSFTGHTGTVMGLAFTRDGRRVISGSLDGTVRVWRLTGSAGKPRGP